MSIYMLNMRTEERITKTGLIKRYGAAGREEILQV